MDLARVIGTVVATQRDEKLGPYQLLIVQPVDENQEPVGKMVVATDTLNRGRGDLVYIVRSGDAMMAHPGEGFIPTDCAIAGLVDDMNVTNVAKKDT